MKLFIKILAILAPTFAYSYSMTYWVINDSPYRVKFELLATNNDGPELIEKRYSVNLGAYETKEITVEDGLTDEIIRQQQADAPVLEGTDIPLAGSVSMPINRVQASFSDFSVWQDQSRLSTKFIGRHAGKSVISSRVDNGQIINIKIRPNSDRGAVIDILNSAQEEATQAKAFATISGIISDYAGHTGTFLSMSRQIDNML